MKFISWNVNGIRAVVKKNFYEFFDEIDADIFSIQESKMQEGQLELDTPGYYQYFNYADKKGYSGTIVFTKKEPNHVYYGMDQDEHNHEGRMITLEYDNFYLVCVYTPNAQDELKRIDYRLSWEEAFKAYVNNLKAKKTTFICGDLNVAHTPKDIKNAKANEGKAGYSIQEREAFTRLLDSGFIDTFRYLYPDVTDAYSWWSYRFKARERNAGWRIDYFLCSEESKDVIQEASIHTDVFGSDHCPIELDVNVEW